jgi:nitroimidazol reductase NimA-like FMN-containing flavoprotein (pyridoxamine 5'-phosphate oxidase superfamily)
MTPDEISRIMSLPLSRELLGSSIPARLAYTARDGSPRVIPIGFHWNGESLVVCTPTNAPKVPALAANPKVAITIDTDAFPPTVLLVRGTAASEVVDGIPDEYFTAAHKAVDDEHWDEWEAGVRQLYEQMVKLTITPTWVKLIDFETTLPTPVQELIDQRQQS